MRISTRKGRKSQEMAKDERVDEGLGSVDKVWLRDADSICR